MLNVSRRTVQTAAKVRSEAPDELVQAVEQGTVSVSLAAQVAGVECETRDYEGDDPLAFVLSLNLKRRQLTASQLAFVALEIEKYQAGLAKGRQGTRSDILAKMPEGFDTGNARDKAAASVGVSRRYIVDHAKFGTTRTSQIGNTPSETTAQPRCREAP